MQSKKYDDKVKLNISFGQRSLRIQINWEGPKMSNCGQYNKAAIAIK